MFIYLIFTLLSLVSTDSYAANILEYMKEKGYHFKEKEVEIEQGNKTKKKKPQKLLLFLTNKF